MELKKLKQLKERIKFKTRLCVNENGYFSLYGDSWWGEIDAFIIYPPKLIQIKEDRSLSSSPNKSGLACKVLENERNSLLIIDSNEYHVQDEFLSLSDIKYLLLETRKPKNIREKYAMFRASIDGPKKANGYIMGNESKPTDEIFYYFPVQYIHYRKAKSIL